MDMFTLRQLRYFEALARHQHFGKAADACSISQPALSMQIKELELSLGSALIERNAKKISMTGFGDQFLGRAREILRLSDELSDMARASHSELIGRLRLGVIPTVAPYLLPKIIRNLSDKYPSMELQLRETITSRMIDELQDGQLDAAIVALPISEPTLEEIELFTENFVLVRPASDAGKPTPNRARLKEMQLLLLEEGHCFRDQALSFCKLQTSRPRELLDGSSLSTLVQMVSAGIGVTLIPDMAVDVETRSAAVSLSRFPPPEPNRKIGIVWRRTSPLVSQLHHVAESVSDAVSKFRQREA